MLVPGEMLAWKPNYSINKALMGGAVRCGYLLLHDLVISAWL